MARRKYGTVSARSFNSRNDNWRKVEQAIMVIKDIMIIMFGAGIILAVISIFYSIFAII